ncbi:MAG: OadG family protein [Lachnospiraceae bacterium]|nr:OadG family protein [Lachnospiraceae bacterium]
MGENLIKGFIILLTGVVVVFAVLLLLIGIITLYGAIVYRIQNKGGNKKEEDSVEVKSEPSAAVEQAVVEEIEPEDDGTVPGEIIAAIAAAVEVIFGEGTVKIKSVKKSSKRRSAWKSAGIAENTRSF